MPVASLAIDLLVALLNNASSISALIQNAGTQNRDITAAELQALLDNDTLARAKLMVAIAAAKAAGK
jgi:hypothetical protein